MTIHYCPVEDCSCPYYNPTSGICALRHPEEECDDYSSYYFAELGALDELEATEIFASYDPE